MSGIINLCDSSDDDLLANASVVTVKSTVNKGKRKSTDTGYNTLKKSKRNTSSSVIPTTTNFSNFESCTDFRTPKKNIKKKQVNRRIEKELKSMEDQVGKDGITFLKCLSTNQESFNGLSIWYFRIEGAKDTLYEGEIFTLRFALNEKKGSQMGYPLRPPEVIFLKNSCPVHEHVYSNGHICLSTLTDDWSPAFTCVSVCKSILSMISSATVKKRPADDRRYTKKINTSGPARTNWDFHDQEC